MRIGGSVRLAIFSLLTSSLALACGDNSRQKDPLDLDERVFLLDHADGFTPVANTTVRLSFQSGELSISAGCNSMGGPFDVKEGELVLHGLSATEVGCMKPGMSAQDDFLSQFVSSRPTLTLQGTELTLHGDQATLVFVDREVARAP